MFDFVKKINDSLYQRYLDIETSYKTYNGSVYVYIQLYLENLLKYVTENLEENFYLDRRESLGSLLDNSILKNALNDYFGIKDLSKASEINKKGNGYKHEEIIDFDQSKVLEYIEYVYDLSIKINNYFSDNISLEFDKNYYLNLDNNPNELIEEYKVNKEKEIAKKDKEIESLLKEKEILNIKYEKALKEREATNQENKKLKELEADYNKKENEIADLKKKRAEYELQVADNLDSEIKKVKNNLGREIKKLTEESLKLKKEISTITEKNVEEYNTKINKFKTLLTEKDLEIEKLRSKVDELNMSKETDMTKNKISTYSTIRNNTNQVFYNNSYVKDDINYTIYNLNDSNLSKSKYSSFYAILHNMLSRNKFINKSKYLEDLNLKDVDYSLIIRLQMTILSLIRNGKLKDDSWKINILNEKKELLEYAIEDIFRKIEIYTTLAKINFEHPVLDLVNLEEYQKDYINISLSAYNFNSNIYYIENRYTDVSSKIWVDNRIKYKVTEKDSNLLLEIIYDIFKFDKFKEGQLPILINTLNGNNTLGILPTGGGKSLIFQFCAFMQPKLTLIVAPINALIKDQIYKLTDIFGITKVANITGGALNMADEINKFENMESLFTFASPERFQSIKFRDILIRHDDKEAIGMVVLDEVHCLSEWGHDFRVSYLMLSHTINNYCKNIQYLGLTATASINVVKDLRIELNIYDPKDIVFSKKLKRKNLNFEIIELSNKDEMDYYLDDVLKDNYGTGNDKDISLNGDSTNAIIVFMKTKSDTYKYYKEYSSVFEEEVERFNGDYKDSQDSFMNNEKSLLFATKAFGMGIDKPNIRNTIHFGIPSSREEFYQEAGRAGRDNQPANCVLVTYKPEDIYEPYIYRFIKQDTNVNELTKIYEFIKWKTDLSTNFFFFLDGIDDPEVEAENAYKLYLEFDNRNKDLQVSEYVKENEKNKKERYLYILHKIGVIYNWTIRYERNGMYFDIELNNNYKDIDHMKFSAEKYILPYLPEQVYLEQIKQIGSIEELKKLLLIVRYWYFETFVKTRREQIANMINFVNSYKNLNNSEEIQNELESFFDISSLIDKAEEGHTLTFEDQTIEDVLYAISLLEDDKLNTRRIEMERLIESVSSHKIDLYLSLINLRLNQFNSRNGKDRLLNSLNYMQETEKVEVYKNIQYVYDKLNKKQKTELLKILFEYDSKMFNNVLLENLDMDYISTLFLIKSINTNLGSII